MRTSKTSKILVAAVSAVVVLVLLAALSPLLVPLLPARVQQFIGGSIDTVPATVEEMFAATGEPDRSEITHDETDEEYVLAATHWPWTLPPTFTFPKNRGVPDLPGHHWKGMGIRAAYSMWATATLRTVESGVLEPAEADALLDELEEATLTLLDLAILTDHRFIDRRVTPLRS